MQSAPSSWDVFCEDYAATLRENRVRLDFFLDFLEEGRSLNFEMIPLKGMELLLRAYPSAGLRPMVDIDLLIRPQDIGRIQSLLENRGFKRKLDFEALSYVLPGTILYLDILWDIWYLPDTAAVCERTVPLTLPSPLRGEGWGEGKFRPYETNSNTTFPKFE